MSFYPTEANEDFAGKSEKSVHTHGISGFKICLLFLLFCIFKKII